jgi:hypothetical protein
MVYQIYPKNPAKNLIEITKNITKRLVGDLFPV